MYCILSIDEQDLPEERREGQKAYRSLNINGRDINFGDGFSDLHNRSYQEILAGRGILIAETKKGTQLVQDIRESYFLN